MTPAAIHLHIDELVLDGFDPRQRHEIADTLQRELTALLKQHDLPPAWRSDVERLDAGTVHTGPNAQPMILGAQIAHALHGGYGR